jgi:hypothetical protein
MSTVAELIASGVPIDRIGRLADGSWAYVAPCPADPGGPRPGLHLSAGWEGVDGKGHEVPADEVPDEVKKMRHG